MTAKANNNRFNADKNKRSFEYSPKECAIIVFCVAEMIMAKRGIAMGKVRILTSVVLLPLRAANTDMKVNRMVKQTIPPKRIQTNAPIS